MTACKKTERYFRFKVIVLGSEFNHCVVDMLPTDPEYKNAQKIIAVYDPSDYETAQKLVDRLNSKYPMTAKQ